MVVDQMIDATDSRAEVLTISGYDAEPIDYDIAALVQVRVRRPSSRGTVSASRINLLSFSHRVPAATRSSAVWNLAAPDR